MTDIPCIFLNESRRLLLSDYLPKIERSLAELSEEDVWWRPNEASNSIGNLMLHLTGNVRQWLVGGVGGKTTVRDRQREFDERSHLPSRELLGKLRETLKEADDALAALKAESLLERRQIQNDDVTVLEAIYHVVEHFGMHTGQIIMMAKLRTSKDLSLWQPRSPSGSTA